MKAKIKKYKPSMFRTVVEMDLTEATTMRLALERILRNDYRLRHGSSGFRRKEVRYSIKALRALASKQFKLPV
jgi:hypothetical protein